MQFGIRISCKIPALRETAEHLGDVVERKCSSALCVLDTLRSSTEEICTRAIRGDGKNRTRKASTIVREHQMRAARFRKIMTRAIAETDGQAETAQTESGESNISRKDVKTLMKRPFMGARLMNGYGVR